MGSTFHQLCPRYSGTLISTSPTDIRLWETFTFLPLPMCMVATLIQIDTSNAKPELMELEGPVVCAYVLCYRINFAKTFFIAMYGAMNYFCLW